MNDDIPLSCALALGGLIGLLLYGPIKRWVGTFIRSLQESRQRRHQPQRGARRNTNALLLIFTTMHPAPWLLLVGLPYALYRLWNDPLRVMWACLLVGALLGPAVLAAYEFAVRSKSRKLQE